MKIPRPQPKIPIPKFASLVRSSDVGNVYEWTLNLPNGRIKHFKRNQSPDDTIEIIAITEDHKIVLVEMEIAGEQVFRLPEMHIPQKANVLENAFRLMNSLGIVGDTLSLFRSGQPNDVGEYPLDWALYIFICSHARLYKNAQLDYNVPYKLTLVSYEEFVTYFDESKIENKMLLYDCIEDLKLLIMN